MPICIRRYQSLFIIYLCPKYHFIFFVNKTQPICFLFLISFCTFCTFSKVKEYETVPAEIHRKSLEHGSSIPAGKFPDFFPVIFDQFLAGKHRKVIGMYRKKSRNFPAGILLPCSDDFRCIPAGSSVFSVSFLQVPSGSGHRNLRPGLLPKPKCKYTLCT